MSLSIIVTALFGRSHVGVRAGLLSSLATVCLACLLTISDNQAYADHRIAGAAAPDRSLNVALIESPNRVRFYLASGPGKKAGWNPESLDISEPILVPGAQLSLQVGDQSDPKLLRITTVSVGGDIVTVTATRDATVPGRVEVVPLIDQPDKFPAGAGFSIVDQGSRRLMFAVTQSGKLFEINLSNGRSTRVGERTDLFVPGGNIGTLDGHADEIFLVDRRGNLVSYVRDPIRTWSGPQLIGMGFRAGSDVTLWKRPDGGREIYIAAVNAKGELRLARHEKTGWRMDVAPGWVVPPGSPVSVFHTPINIRMLGVNSDGTLVSMHLVNTEWRERIIGRGFRYKTTAIFPVHSLSAFSIDAAGDLLASVSSDDVWRSQLIPYDGGDERGIVATQDFRPPSTTTNEFRFWNRSDVEVTLRLYDAQHPSSVQNHVLSAGKSLSFNLESPIKRSLRTTLIQPSPQAAGAPEAESIDTEIERTREVICDSPYEVEILKSGPGLHYDDQRHHKFPRLTQGEPAQLSLGVFSLPRGIDLPPGKSFDVDAVNSAEKRQFLPSR